MAHDRQHLEGLLPCPHLPEATEPLSAVAMKRCGKDRGRDFYLLALQCAQSLWLQGLPAQSLLLINRAMGADHQSDPEMCGQFPMPYQAAAWVMRARTEEQFIGNPRRHYQHLATRMVEPRKEQRSWRAWGCWYLSCNLFPDYPADEKQIAEEGIIEPSYDLIVEQLDALGIAGETKTWQSTVTEYTV